MAMEVATMVVVVGEEENSSDNVSDGGREGSGGFR